METQLVEINLKDIQIDNIRLGALKEEPVYDSPLEGHVLSHIKTEPADTSTKDEDISEGFMERNAGEAKELERPLFVQIKEEPVTENTSDGAHVEETFESNTNTEEYFQETSMFEECAAVSVYTGSMDSSDHYTESSLNTIDKNIYDSATSSSLGKLKIEPVNKNQSEYRKKELLDSTSESEYKEKNEINALEQAGACTRGRQSHDASLNQHQREPRLTQIHCEICGKSFQRNANFQRHRLVHTGEKPFQCLLCKKSFAEKSNLEVHMRVHSDERPFNCTICTKTFRRRAQLNMHMQLHSGEKPFKCKMCEKTFRDKNLVIYHMRTHTGERPYKCDECDKTFTLNSSLVCHMRTHTGEKSFKCRYCEKVFYKSSGLTTHLRTHTNEKPFKCSKCKKEFSDKSNLTRHTRIHSKEWPFSCSVCGILFLESADLIHHKQRRHGDTSSV